MARRFPNSTTHRAYSDLPPVTAAPLTMACWARIPATGTSRTMMQIGDKDSATTDNKFRLVKNSSDQVAFAAATGSLSTVTNTSATMAVNEWVHCAGTASATISPKNAFINGVGTTLGATNRVPAGVDSFVIGASLRSTSTYAEAWSGEIFWPAVWNVELSDAEIELLSSGVSPQIIRPANLVFFAREDDQRHILLDAAQGQHMRLDLTEFVPTIPARVAARLPRRAKGIYGFSSASPSFNPAWAKGSNVILGVA
jgi:hypothetical protein